MLSKNKKIRKRRKRIKNIASSVILGLLVLFIAGVLIDANIKINKKRSELLSRAEYLKSQVQILEERNEELKDTIAQAGSQEYLERVALEQLGLKPPGSEVVVVSKEDEEESEVEEAQGKNTWQKLLKRIGF